MTNKELQEKLAQFPPEIETKVVEIAEVKVDGKVELVISTFKRFG